MKQLLTLLTLVCAVTMTMLIASGSAYAVNNEASQQQVQNTPLNVSHSCSLNEKKA